MHVALQAGTARRLCQPTALFQRLDSRQRKNGSRQRDYFLTATIHGCTDTRHQLHEPTSAVVQGSAAVSLTDTIDSSTGETADRPEASLHPQVTSR